MEDDQGLVQNLPDENADHVHVSVDLDQKNDVKEETVDLADINFNFCFITICFHVIYKITTSRIVPLILNTNKLILFYIHIM